MPRAPLTPALYDAVVTHTRRERIRRTFTHRIYLWLVDLDALPRLPRWLTPFARFQARDHLGDPRRCIRDNLDRWLSDQGIDLHGGRILMLTNARSLGYVFNPITIYWCHQPDDTLECVVAEVHNTYGGRHCYLLRLDPHHRGQADKQFYVSPFLAVDGTYLMRVADPGPTLSVSVVLRRQQHTALAVRLRGERRPATTRHLVRTLLRQPLGSYRTATLIRLHGIALWLRRIPIVPRPPHTAQKGVQ
jgi:DUF1365 family protein